MTLDLDTFQGEWGQWVAKALPEATTKGHIEKLKGEVVELQTAFNAEVPISDELADCILLCLAIAHRHGISAADAITKKFEVNKGRTWGKPVNGMYQHDSSDSSKEGK